MADLAWLVEDTNPPFSLSPHSKIISKVQSVKPPTAADTTPGGAMF